MKMGRLKREGQHLINLIGDIAYKSDIYFYKNGKLKQGTLLQDIRIKEISIDEGSTLYYKEDGTISGWK